MPWDLTLTIAALGLLRPEISKLCSFIFRRGKVEISGNGTVELGFNRVGPYITIGGSIAAEERDCRLVRAEVLITREEDGSTRKMRWAVFRSNHISGPYAMIEELPRMIKLPKDEVYPFNIAFCDERVKNELNGVLQDLTKELQGKVFEKREKIVEERKRAGDADLDDQSVFDEAMKSVLSMIRSVAKYIDAADCVSRNLFWRPGDYTLTLSGETNRKKQKVEKSWKFKLDEVDYKNLKGNVFKVCEDALLHGGNLLFSVATVQCTELAEKK